MRTKLFLYLFILVAAFLASCTEEDSDIVLPKQSPKLVLSSFICPDDTMLFVYVSQTSPILGAITSEQISNATVSLIHGTDTIDFSYNANFQAYTYQTSNSFLLENEIYTITASTPDGRKVSGSCKIPTKRNINFSYQLDSINNGTKSTYFINLKWKDSTDQIYYYRPKVRLSYYYLLDSTFIFNEAIVTSNSAEIITGKQSTDSVTAQFKTNEIPTIAHKMMIVQLITVDEPYYLFEISPKNIFSFPNYEPYAVYSNTTGGLGIVGSYNNKVENFVNLN